MRHHLRLRVLLPALASLVAACGGSTASIDGASTSSSGASSGTATSSGGTSGSTSGIVSSSSSSSGEPEVVFESNYCEADNTYAMGTGLSPSGLDSIEIRDDFEHDAAPFVSRGVSGIACATASDKPKCASALASFGAEGWQVMSSGERPSMKRYAVTTKGDSIAAITDPAALAGALGPIDTPKEAALILTARGDKRPACDGTNNVIKTATGFDVKVLEGEWCGSTQGEWAMVYSVTADGAFTFKSKTLHREGTDQCAIGRRPEGLVAQSAGECADAVGRFFAEAAHLEAASVVSFERLAGELLELGAPASLIDAAHASREDEVRHARMTSRMAKRFGGTPAAPRVEEQRDRSKLAIALENATEGCVRETFGALVAHRQAAHASDESIRAMMQVIAEDETRHAGLAWDVAAWLEPQLTVDERVLVEDARRRALAELRAELEADVHPDLRTRAGMPDAATAIALLDALDQRFIADA